MFNPMAGIVIATLMQHMKEKHNIVELGNQRLGHNAIPEITKILGKPMLVGQSTKDFYEIDLGFDEYVALDVNEEMGATICDLNYDVRYKITDQFDLVTNNGTGEHIFDQKMVFENVHNLCKTDGIMVHILPFIPWLNHGFFNFNPIVFRDIAGANNYEWLLLWIGNRWGDRIELGEWAFKEKNPKELQESVQELMGRGDLFVIAAYRKINDEPFKIPVQGKYEKDISDDQLKERYCG